MSASSSSYQLVTQQAKPPSDAQLHTYHQSTFEQTEHQPQSHYQDSQFSDELQGFEDIQAEDEAAFMTQQQVLNGHADSDLPPLQSQTVVDQNDKLEPISEDDPTSYELVEPPLGDGEGYSLEQRSLQLFSKEHLQVIFADGNYLLRFTSFLGAHRPQSVPTLIHYLDCLKALRAVQYSNAILEGLEPIAEVDSTKRAVKPTINADLEARADAAFAQLVKEELPAYITHQYIDIVSSSIVNRITGALAPHLREASEGLAEVFCLTDPSRPDNPIVFASEEFNRTTQYGMNYVLGRNCRFLQGPHTNPDGVRRFRETVAAGQPHHEILLNYRRDGSPFMNLLLSAPLTDSRGIVRYYIGAQVDVSGLIKDCVELESLSKLIELQERGLQPPCLHKPSAENEDPLRDLAEMLNQGELSTIIKFGGRMHRETVQTRDEGNGSGPGSDAGLSHQRLMIRDPEALTPPSDGGFSGRLGGIYQHYLLIRPYPALRILFASPSQRIPGLLQSPFLNKIGGSSRVRDELTAAFAEGRGVTAKVRWISKSDEEGRNKWIHCTPLLGSGGAIGVWMVVIVDDERSLPRGAITDGRRFRAPPPIANGSAAASRSTSVEGRRSQLAGVKRNGVVVMNNMMMNGTDSDQRSAYARDASAHSNFSRSQA